MLLPRGFRRTGAATEADAGDEHPDAGKEERSEPTISIGEIVGVHGLKGDVKVRPQTSFPERLTRTGSVALRMPDGQIRYVVIEQARRHKTGMLMKIEGIDSIEEAETLRGARFVIGPHERVSLPEGTYYIDDLVGLDVVTDDGRDLGRVLRVLQGPANDVYDLGDLLIPAIGDVVLSIDLQEGRMTVHPIPGLLDDAESD